jgi:hypothetical protein
MSVDEGVEGVEMLGEEGDVLLGKGLGVGVGRLMNDSLVMVDGALVVLPLRLDVA